MEIDRQWWDGETTNITARSESATILATLINTTMETKIRANFEKYSGEWDKTVSPWKINSKSALFSKAWSLTWNDSNSVMHNSFSRFFKERKKGYNFYLTTEGWANSYTSSRGYLYPDQYYPNWLATINRADFDITDTVMSEHVTKKYGYYKPVINFNYARLFIVPILKFHYGNTQRMSMLARSMETNFDPTQISGFTFQFMYIDKNGTPREFPMNLVSLNNPISPPSWYEWNTNCWQSEVLDNGLSLTSYYISGGDTYNKLPDIGDAVQFGSENGTVFYTGAAVQTESAAATLNYFSSKAIPTFTNAMADRDPDIFSDNWTSFYVSGDSAWGYSKYRNLKNTVTFQNMVDYIATEAAYLGFKFCLFDEDLRTGMDGQYFYISEIDEKGVTTGNYYAMNSDEAQVLPNFNWALNVYELTPYDGTDDEEDLDPNTYSDTTDWNDFTESPTLSFTDMYIVDELSIAGLATKFFESLSLKPVDQLVTEYFSQTYLTTEPTDVIVSLRYYYIPLQLKVSHSENLEEILLGTYHTGVSAYNVTCTTARYDYGEHYYYPYFGDFRDYAPYSTAILIIPYCGTVSIDPQEFMGHWIRVQLVVDYATGTCTAYIMKDELVVNSISGQIGIEIPVTAIAGQDLQRNLFNGYQNLKAAKLQSAQSMAQGAMSFLGSAMSSNPLGMAQSVMSTIFGEERSEIGIEAAEYNLQHTQVPFRQVGSINPGAAVRQEQQCRLIIFRPVMDPDYDPVEYGHVTGFATLETGLLSEYTGFTQCSNVILDSLPCTIEEKQSIERLLQSGVYL